MAIRGMWKPPAYCPNETRQMYNPVVTIEKEEKQFFQNYILEKVPTARVETTKDVEVKNENIEFIEKRMQKFFATLEK